MAFSCAYVNIFSLYNYIVPRSSNHSRFSPSNLGKRCLCGVECRRKHHEAEDSNWIRLCRVSMIRARRFQFAEQFSIINGRNIQRQLTDKSSSYNQSFHSSARSCSDVSWKSVGVESLNCENSLHSPKRRRWNFNGSTPEMFSSPKIVNIFAPPKQV